MTAVNQLPALRFRQGLAALALFAVACGSTVAQPQTAVAPAAGQVAHASGLNTGSTGPGTGLAAPASATDAAPTPAASSRGGQAASSPIDRAATAAGPASGASPEGPTTTPQPVPAVPGGHPAPAPGEAGESGEPIEIGIGVPQGGAQEAFDAMGFGAIKVPDGRAMYQAVIDDLNTLGGLAGRQVVPVWGELPAVVTAQYQSQMQAICTQWTQDHHVVAVMALPQETLAGCLNQAGVPLFADFTLQDSQGLAELSNMVIMSFPELGRMAGAWVDGLAEQGWFESTDPLAPTKVGLLVVDTPSFMRADTDHLRPALAGHGLDVAAEAVLTNWATNGDVGGLQAQIANAVLRFAAEGVTHVLFLTINGSEVYLFANQAESQAFRPRYGLSSMHGPEAIKALIPAAQLEGAAGLGWIPGSDVIEDAWPEPTTEHARCEQVMADHEVALSANTDFLAAYATCTHIWLLESLGATTPASLLAAVDGFGDRQFSLVTFATRLGGGRRDAAELARPFAYDPSCACFTYAGDLRPIAG